MPGAGWPGSRSCQKCQQPVIWVPTKNGWSTPINPEPAGDGKLAITDGDPPTVRHLWHDMEAEEHEWLVFRLAVASRKLVIRCAGGTKPWSGVRFPGSDRYDTPSCS
jgi:hypothetical protein